MEIAVLSKLQQRATVEVSDDFLEMDLDLEFVLFGKINTILLQELKAELDKFLHHLKNNTHSRLVSSQCYLSP